MIDAAEEITDARFCDSHPAPDEARAESFLRLGRKLLRPEPERGVTEVSLEDRFEYYLRRLLHHLIADHQNAQWPPSAFGISTRRTGRGTIPALLWVTGDLAEHPLNPVLLHLYQRLPVKPSSTSIGPDSLPRLHQDVTPVNPIEQGVEAPLRRLLGRSP